MSTIISVDLTIITLGLAEEQVKHAGGGGGGGGGGGMVAGGPCGLQDLHINHHQGERSSSGSAQFAVEHCHVSKCRCICLG